jgi:hypothetical protein
MSPCAVRLVSSRAVTAPVTSSVPALVIAALAVPLTEPATVSVAHRVVET